MSAERRLKREFNNFIKDPPLNCSGGPVTNKINNVDYYKWNATITGPQQSPYENGIFNLEIIFPINYPFKPPCIKY